MDKITKLQLKQALQAEFDKAVDIGRATCNNSMLPPRECLYRELI